MAFDAIVTRIIELLRQHKDGKRGSIHQEPYKNDLFRLFANAYNDCRNENLQSDHMLDIINTRAPDVVTEELTSTFLSFWSEWLYAWKRSDQINK